MWALAFSIYAVCKWLTWWRARASGATFWRQLGYLLAWPGLDADSFLQAGSHQSFPPPRLREWLFASLKLTAGVGVLYGAVPLVPRQSPYLAGWVGMIGLILILHFGVFHLLSCVWRRMGVEARPLMDWPLASTSVSQFWGRRWNTAFRDLTHRIVFRPLAGHLGPRGATGAGFLFSGVVHDLVISVPAGGGYGGSTLFFAVQAAAIFVERSGPGRQIGLGRGRPGWLFAMMVLLAPLGWLFHPPFVLEVVVPFLVALRALP